MTPAQSPRLPARRTPLIDALRAVAALVIVWHHFALYGPLSDWAWPWAGPVLDFFKHYARATQIFFVVGGYVLARSMTRRNWRASRVGLFVVHRYLRLGIPYLGAIALAIVACHFGRGILPEHVVGPDETWPAFGRRLLAHLFFLQDILGFQSFSAGLWFVCINFQLSLVFAAMLWLRDAASPNVAGTLRVPSAEAASPNVARTLRVPSAPAPPMANLATSSQPIESPEPEPPSASRFGNAIFSLLGWSLAAIALFYYNRDDRWDDWFIYFFAHFYLGVIVHQALTKPRHTYLFWLYVMMVGAAIVVDWRWRLISTLASGLILFAGGRLGFLETWPKSRVLGYLGRTSYSLFLVHFAALVGVATAWTRLDWRQPWQATAGLGSAFLVSLIVADLFYRGVESPSARLSRRVRY